MLEIRKTVRKIIRMYVGTKENVLKYIYAYVHPKRVLKIKKRIRKSFEENERINVAFFVQFPEMWNSLKSIYKAMAEDKRFFVKIVAIPKRRSSNLFHTTFEEKNDAYEFFQNIGLKAVDAYEFGKWMDIKKLKLDYIFLQRPYDTYMPKEYSMYKLSHFALLCYVSYGYEFVYGNHLEIEYNKALLDNVYMIFCENRDTYQYCCIKNKRAVENRSRIIFNIGYPRFDLISQELPAIKSNQGKNVLWLPRWSMDEDNDRSHFQDYLELLLNYFEKNKHNYLIIRPHPLMFKNFIDSKVMSKDDVFQLKARILRLPNIKFDENTDYMDSLKKSDILIADFTSLLIEFFLMKKPILYCGNTCNFNSVGKIMEKGLYCIQTKDMLISVLNDLLAGKDIKKEQYIAAARKIAPEDRNIGNEIKMAMVQDVQT